MATITGYTADRMQTIEDGTITAGSYDASGHLILTRHDGTQLDVGRTTAATTAQSGIVELATNAETLAGTDTSRAITPAGLASLPGTRVQVLTSDSQTEAALQSAYPVGASLMLLTTSSGWSINGGAGTVVTQNISSSRAIQTFYENAGGTASTKAWVREFNSAVGGGGWTAWAQMVLMVQLNAANFTQSSTRGSYPTGTSRLYYTSATSSAWDFTGNAGEVITYVDGTDFARQTYTKHVGGTSTTEVWTRTSTSAGGWTGWFIVAEDTGWVNMTLSGGYTAVQQIAARRRNGVVYLRGHFQAPTGGFTTCATLPTSLGNMKPAADRVWGVGSNTATSMAAQIIASTGVIQTWTAASTTAWFSIATSYPVG